jgi:hypothetical protein
MKYAIANSAMLALAAVGVARSHDLPEIHGRVALANDSLITQSTYNEELTTYGIGFSRGNGLNRLRDFLAPKRTSGRVATLTQYSNTEPFEVVDWKKVRRAPLSDFMEVSQRTSTKVPRLIPNRGLTICLDRDQLKDKPNWQQMHIRYLIDLLTAAEVLETTAAYTAGATAVPLVWGSSANPDLDVRSRFITAANTLGMKPNRAAYGDAAELLRLQSFEAQNNAGAYARAAMLTEQQLATAIGADQVLVNAERYQNTSSAKLEFIGSSVLLFTAVDGESPMDPSNIVRHVANASYGGGEYAVYITEQGVKRVWITVENYSLIAVQHVLGLLKLNVTAT